MKVSESLTWDTHKWKRQQSHAPSKDFSMVTNGVHPRLIPTHMTSVVDHLNLPFGSSQICAEGRSRRGSHLTA